MIRDRRRLRRATTLIAGVVLIVGVDVALLRTASAKTDFEVLNGTINAGADSVVYYNGAFPNWAAGVVSNTYPLAHGHIDNSPFAEATSTPADTGPLGGTATGAWNSSSPPPPILLAQPQYASAKYPPGSKKPSTVGSPGGPYAQASAAANTAIAYATAADTTQSTPASQSSAQATGAAPAPALGATPAQPAAAPSASARSAQIAAFNAAMNAWRSRYLTSAAAARYPGVAASASTPDGTDGDTASASVILDPDKGLVTVGDSRLHQATFGGGAFVLHGLRTAVTITNSGTPKADTVVTIADASVGGVPVSVGKDGVTAGSGTVPLDATQQASAALNQALAAAGVKVATIAPQVKTSTAQETVMATAVTVTIDQPGPPEQKVQHNLGSVFADDLAIPAQPAMLSTGATDTFSPGGVVGTAPQTEFIPGTSGTSGTLGSSAAAGSSPSSPAGGSATSKTPLNTQRAAVATSAHVKPSWLLLLYFAWQALLIGTVASLWWVRMARQAAGAAT